MSQEACPDHLDEDAREIWQQCRWIIEGGKCSASAALQLQALVTCRELRQESRANQIQAELDALRFQLVELAGKCGVVLSPCNASEAMAAIEMTIRNLRRERSGLIAACKNSARMCGNGCHFTEVADSLIEAVRIATGN